MGGSEFPSTSTIRVIFGLHLVSQMNKNPIKLYFSLARISWRIVAYRKNYQPFEIR